MRCYKFMVNGLISYLYLIYKEIIALFSAQQLLIIIVLVHNTVVSKCETFFIFQLKKKSCQYSMFVSQLQFAACILHTNTKWSSGASCTSSHASYTVIHFATVVSRSQ